MRIGNLCYQDLDNKNCPEYLKLNFPPKKFLLGSCNDNGPMVEISRHRSSFTSRAGNFLKIINDWTKKILCNFSCYAFSICGNILIYFNIFVHFYSFFSKAGGAIVKTDEANKSLLLLLLSLLLLLLLLLKTKIAAWNMKILAYLRF